MDALRLETMSLTPTDAAGDRRRHALDVAGQFEAVFVRTLVQSMRQTATVGGGGMFGEGPGAGTYADWFDQNVATELGRGGGIGIAATVLADMQRHGELEPAARPAADDPIDRHGERLRTGENRGAWLAATAKSRGGIDVVL